MYDISVVVSTYNERLNIKKLLIELEESFKANKLKGEIVIVDDNSPDGTAAIIKEYSKRFSNIKLIIRQKKMGIASAYGTGVRSASGKIIVTMDADFSHPPTSLGSMIREARKGFIVSGSRFLKNGDFQTKFYRKMGAIFLNKWERFIFNTGITDHTNGYLAISRTNLEKINNFAKKINIYPFDKILYGVRIFGIGSYASLPLKEVRAIYKFRKKGCTKINFFTGLKVVFDHMIYILNLFFKLKKLKSNNPRLGCT
jgi:dolichol-phosphate mannosyltransferase